MATRSKRLTGATLAESKVRVGRGDAVRVYTLPVNPGFADPNEPDRERGVDYLQAIENDQAEMGIARRVMGGLLPPNLASWVRGQVKRRGGTRRLAEALVAMKHDPKHPDTEVRNLQRKLQEYTEEKPGKGAGKYKKLGGLNAARVGLLRLTEAKHLVVGVLGIWVFSHDARYTTVNTDPGDQDARERAIEALRSDGSGLIPLVEAWLHDEAPQAAPNLVKTHLLRVEIMTA